MTLELAGLALAALALAAGQGPRLDVKPGLWEMKSTTSTKMEGELPHADPSKLTPEQRARVEEARERLASGKPHTTVLQSCVTEKDLEKGLGFDDATDRDKDCQRRYVDRTSKHLRVEVKCAPKEGARVEGAWEFTVKASDLVVAHGEMKAQTPGHSSTSRMDMTARRLGSSCGDLKPGKSRTISR